MTLTELFDRHPILALDSNVLIYLLEGEGPLADTSQAIVDGLEAGRSTGVLATLGLTEILAGPATAGDGMLFEHVAAELRDLPGVRLVPLDVETAIDAAWGRSGGRHRGDAVHVATARNTGATCIVTNDERLHGREGVEVILLSSIGSIESESPEPTPETERPLTDQAAAGSDAPTTGHVDPP